MCKILFSVVGLGLGLLLTHLYILPLNAPSIKLADLTIFDLLRILAGLITTLVTTFLGLGVGKIADKGKEARLRGHGTTGKFREHGSRRGGSPGRTSGEGG